MSACFGDRDSVRGRVQWSPSVVDLIGEPAPGAEVPVGWWRGRVHPDDVGEIDSRESAIEGGADRWSGRYRVRRADGSWIEVLERAFAVRKEGRVVRVVSAIDAVGSDEESAEDAGSLLARLERSEAEFRTFVECIAQLAWTMTRDGWIDFYNQRWYDYTGTSFEDMEGWGWVQVHDPDDLPRMLRIWRRSLATGQPWEDEFRLRRADGAMRWHLSRAMPLRDATGRIVRWFGTNTDVHDQKLALEERSVLLAREKEARRQAEEANRAKDEFLAVVSHELRTPLNSILGWATMLETGVLSPERRRDAIRTIERSARHQSVLIEDLLDTSRVLSGRLEIERVPLRCVEPVQSALEAVRPRAEEAGVRLALVEADPSATTMGDRVRLEQVVTNLLSNAIKFSPEGGLVELRVSADADGATIEVHDEGEGIEPELLPRVFETFLQADGSTTRRHGGLGLGLSIARRIVDLHGGELTAESPGKGRGATFRVRLPRAEVEGVLLPFARRDPEEAAPPASLRGIAVLAVDDDARTRELLSTLLLASGATVVTAGSVAEALEAIRAHPPDVVVSDIAMPEVDGYGLVARLRQLEDPALAGLPVLALTAFASLQDRARALEAGFDDYLAKPVDPARLSRALAALVRSRVVGEPQGSAGP